MPMPRPSVPHRIDTLQCLRGLAALGVFLSHLSEVEKLRFGGHLLPGTAMGAFGVDLFFVLSGFVLTLSLARRPQRGVRAAAGFMAARWGRIFPVYWAVLLPCLLIAAVAPAWITDADYPPLLQTALLLPAAAPPLLHPAWSLVHELYFYELLALLLVAPRRWLVPGLLAWGGAMAMVQLVHGGRIADPVLHLLANPLNLEFLLGAAVGLSLDWLKPARPRLQMSLAAVAFLAGAAVLTRIIFSSHEGEVWRLFLVGLPAAAMVSAATALRPAGRAAAWLKALGDRSYAFYLVHFPICLSLATWLKAGGHQGPTTTIVYVTAACALSAVATETLHRLVERPTIVWSHRLAQRIGRPRRAAPAAPALSGEGA
jgi:exopolysaccharide production protein ExoZ